MAISLEQFKGMTAEQQAALLAGFQKQRKLTIKVSEKGAVSVYGMGKWPVTLYAGQWERLLDNAQEIRDYIEANRASLAVKE